MATYGETLKELRRDRKMTLCDVADAAGISLAYLSSIERGVRSPPDDETLRRILEAMGEVKRFAELKRLAKESKQDSMLRESLKDLPKKKQDAIMLLARSSSDSAIWDQVFKAFEHDE